MWTFTGVPPGSGPRRGIDRDDDGTPDGEDGVELVAPAVAGCSSTPHAYVNDEPRIGNAGFALVCAGLPPGATGTMVFDRIPSWPTTGSPFLASAVNAPFGGGPVVADAEGFAWLERPIPSDPTLIGRTFMAVATFPDPCAPDGHMASETWVVTVRP